MVRYELDRNKKRCLAQGHSTMCPMKCEQGTSIRGSRMFFSEGTILTFLVKEGREDFNTCTTLSGASSAFQRNAISMALRGVPMMAKH